MKHKQLRRLSALYAVVLIAFTTYALLDTFVIPHSYQAVPTASQETQQTAAGSSAEAAAGSAAGAEATLTAPQQTQSVSADSAVSAASAEEQDASGTLSADEAESSAEESSEAIEAAEVQTFTEPVITETSYQDNNISIVISTYRENDTTIYAADITLSSPEYLKTALAQSTYGRNISDKTSSIAAEAGAILAINGDYYGAQERGYVIRNGVLYRDTAASGNEDLVIYSDGSVEIIAESDCTAQSLLESGAQQVLSFGPGLLSDGAITVTENQEVGKARTSNPRTAFGILGPLHYVFVVADGRTSESAGLSLYQLASFMQSLGCEKAYNLDGGGSSTMVFNGSVINNPTSDGKRIKERSVSDIVYIGTN